MSSWCFDPTFCSHRTICLECCRLIFLFWLQSGWRLILQEGNYTEVVFFFFWGRLQQRHFLCVKGRSVSQHVLCHKCPPQWRQQTDLPGRVEPQGCLTFSVSVMHLKGFSGVLVSYYIVYLNLSVAIRVRSNKKAQKTIESHQKPQKWQWC